jgi:hypothetical protein
MNELPLPDDFSRWPTNPFELFGVQRGVDERELRRAYTRLIRVYKPEQFPEHFRRIREAYEAARNFARYFSAVEAPSEPQIVPTESPPAAEQPTPRLQSFEEELDAAWSAAIEGDEARAYARLLELQEWHPERSETYRRLYCLLDASPELDVPRAPCDFLAQGLCKSGGSGPCHELYRRAIEDHPDEALTERFAELLAATSQPGMLATFVQWRWSAAGRQKRFAVIGNDVPGLKARLAVDHEEIWLRLLGAAADQLAWAPLPNKAFQIPSFGLAECLEEAARHAHLQLPCADVYDRLEFLERVAAGWHLLLKEGYVPAECLELLSHSWTRPFAELRRRVTALLGAIAAKPDSAKPEAWLNYLDRILAVSPELLSIFGRMLDAYQWTVNVDDDHRDPAELAVLARRFIELHGGLPYGRLRSSLLAFCLRELIHPDIVAQVPVSQGLALSGDQLQRLASDWPLRHVYRACFLFRC